VPYLLEQEVHLAVLECLREAGTDCATWDASKLYATKSTNLLMSFCRFPEAAAAVRVANGVELMTALLSSACIERLKAAFILSFLVGKEEAASLASSGSLLQAYPDLIKMLIDVFTNTLASKGGDGYKLGNFEVHSIVGAILALSISDANKAVIVDAPLLPLLIRVLVMYRDDEPAIKLSYGGGKDVDSAGWADAESRLLMDLAERVEGRRRRLRAAQPRRGVGGSIVGRERVAGSGQVARSGSRRHGCKPGVREIHHRQDSSAEGGVLAHIGRGRRRSVQ
jgi:hypothetical protein